MCMKKYTLQDKLSRIKEKTNWTQQRIADECGLGQAHVCKILKGVYKAGRSTEDTAVRINDLYNKLFKVK